MIEMISKGDFYGMTDKYEIDAGDYNDLLKAGLMLKALMDSGVEDWCGWPDAVAEYARLERGLDNEENC